MKNEAQLPKLEKFNSWDCCPFEKEDENVYVNSTVVYEVKSVHALLEEIEKRLAEIKLCCETTSLGGMMRAEGICDRTIKQIQEVIK